MWLSLTSGQGCLPLKLVSNMRSLYSMQLPTQTSSSIHIKLSAMSVQYFSIYVSTHNFYPYNLWDITIFYSIKHAHKQRWKPIYQINFSCASKTSYLTDRGHATIISNVNSFILVWAKVCYQNDLVLSPPITASQDCVQKPQACECKIAWQHLLLRFVCCKSLIT